MSYPAAVGYDTFEIPVERVKELQERVAKLNKKAAKLGTPAIDLIVKSDTRQVTVSVGGMMALRMGTKYTYTVQKVLIKGETPKLNGWEFLSVVLHRPAGNEFINVTDTDADLSSFVFADKHCDHCRKNRVRNATFLVRHDGGAIMQVGSTCLEDFTGVKSPQAHARQMENIFNLFRELRGGSWGGSSGRTSKTFFLSEWLAFVAMQIRKDGRYIGRNAATTHTTGEAAKALIIAASESMDAEVPTDGDYALAEKWIAWVRSDEGRDTFTKFDTEKGGDYGLQMLAATKSDDSDAVADNTMKLVAPLPVFYDRVQREKAASVAQTTQEYFGSIGERVNRTLTVDRISREMAGDFGAFAYVNFSDAAGRHYKASMNCKITRNLKVGQTLALRGTVKAQAVDNYTGNKTTTLNRCQII